jgi:hypothetical protein
MTARLARVVATVVVAVATLPATGGITGGCAHTADAAPATHRAGLIVEFPDQSVKRFCVPFTEDTITGYELLRRTGLKLGVQDFGGGNLAVCSIDGKGCDFPQEPCFCECAKANSRECTFWGFYTVEAGTWKFQNLGPSMMKARDGDVHGWRWGRHGTGGASPPPREDLAKVCAQAIATGPTAATKHSSFPAAPVAVAAVLAMLAAAAIIQARKKPREDDA